MSSELRHKRLYDDAVAMEIHMTSLDTINISFIRNIQEELSLQKMHKWVILKTAITWVMI